MYSIFRVNKKTGTYSDTIEAFGLANLIHEIQERSELARPKLWIEDKGLYYELTSKPEIGDEDISNLDYFPLFQYVIRKDNESFDEEYFDYPKQRILKKKRQELIQKAYKEYAGKSKTKQLKKRLDEIEKTFENENYISPKFDVYSQIVTPNNFVAFDKLFKNLSSNKELFPDMIETILSHYSIDHQEKAVPRLNVFNSSITALQLYNPTTGKGQNKSKATGASAGPVKLSWINETMKISGAITNMLCQLVKVGSSYDLKVVVADFKKTEYSHQKNIALAFKKNVKGNTPLKVDILNLLIVIKQLIVYTDEYNNFKARNILSGLHSTYQKDLGQNKAVVNISELQSPDFVEFSDEKEAKDWVHFLDEQIRIIGSIEELGDATQGLISYRTFLTSSDFMSWAKFAFWYTKNLMSILSKNKYAIAFKTNTLNKFFENMSMKNFKISAITSSEGFQKVAYAIRKSTVTLQYTPKEQRHFEIRYGVAQSLQNKSKSASDLAAYIGEFIGVYNSETARKAELNKGFRKIVREDELNEFYSLLDIYPSKVVGALLASYGFALEEKEAKKIENMTENDESNEINNQ